MDEAAKSLISFIQLEHCCSKSVIKFLGVILLLVFGCSVGASASVEYSSVETRDYKRFADSSNTVKSSVRELYVALKAGDVESADNVSNRLLRRDKLNSVFIRLRGQALLLAGRRADAADYFMRAWNRSQLADNCLAYAQLTIADTLQWVLPTCQRYSSRWIFHEAAVESIEGAELAHVVDQDPSFYFAACITSIQRCKREDVTHYVHLLLETFPDVYRDSAVRHVLLMHLALQYNNYSLAQLHVDSIGISAGSSRFRDISLSAYVKDLEEHDAKTLFNRAIEDDVDEVNKPIEYSRLTLYQLTLVGVLCLHIVIVLVNVCLLGIPYMLRRIVRNRFMQAHATGAVVDNRVFNSFVLTTSIVAFITQALMRLLYASGFIGALLIIYIMWMGSLPNEPYTIARFVVGVITCLILIRASTPFWSSPSIARPGIEYAPHGGDDLTSLVHSMAVEENVHVDEIRLSLVAHCEVIKFNKAKFDGRKRSRVSLVIGADLLGSLSVSELQASIRTALRLYKQQNSYPDKFIRLWIQHLGAAYQAFVYNNTTNRFNYGWQLTKLFYRLWIPILLTWEDVSLITAVSSTARDHGKDSSISYLIKQLRREYSRQLYFTEQEFKRRNGIIADAWKSDLKVVEYIYAWYHAEQPLDDGNERAFMNVRRWYSSHPSSLITVGLLESQVRNFDNSFEPPDARPALWLLKDRSSTFLRLTEEHLGAAATQSPLEPGYLQGIRDRMVKWANWRTQLNNSPS